MIQRMKLKKFCLVLSLIAVFLFTGLIGGPGIVFADEPEPDWSQIIADLDDLRDSLDNLSPDQVEDAVDLWEKMIKMLWGQGGNPLVLSAEEQSCLNNKFGINYTIALAPVNSFKNYVNSNTSNKLTGYEGFVNALQTPDSAYLVPLCGTLYNALGTPVISKLEEHKITIDELVGIIADLAKVKFTPGLALTPEVNQQITAVLNKLVGQSNLTNDDLICCGLTGENFGELLGQLSEEEKASLEDVFDTMGNIDHDQQGTVPQAIVEPVNGATGVALNAVVSAVFDQDVTPENLAGVTIKDAADNLVGGINTALAADQRTLNIAHDLFAYNTVYTVTIPAGAVQASEGKAGNAEITWSFQILAPPQGDYILAVTTNKPSYSHGETVNVTGTLKQNNQEQTPVENVSIGLQLIKDNLTTVAVNQVITDANGVFTWQIPTGWLDAGSYTVFATANVASTQTTFAITEAVVVAPTVQTNAATGITTNSATLNGNITNTGGEDCNQRKFQYKQQGAASWTDTTVETGSFGTGDFKFDLTGLTPNTTYEVKALAHNTAGWGEGTVLTFTTLTSGGSTGGGGGGGGGSTCVLDVDTYMPAASAENVAIDTVVKVTFKQNISAVDLTKVSVKDALNNIVSGVKATVDGKVLTITHDNFAYNTKYTVSLPYGTLKRSDCTTNNSSLSWSFTTAKETILPQSCVYSDVPENYWAAGVIKELCEKGILDGYPDGTFRPRNDITRAEFTKIIAVALGLAEEDPATPTFKDVAPGDWYYGVVEAAAKADLVKGYGKGLFKPNAKITREEITAILIRALGKQDEAAANANTMTSFKDDGDIASWARGSVVVAFNEGLIKGYPNGTFGPKKNAIRAEVCAMVSRMLAKK